MSAPECPDCKPRKILPPTHDLVFTLSDGSTKTVLGSAALYATELLAALRALVTGVERAAAAGVDLAGHLGVGDALAVIARAEGREADHG